MSKRVYFETVKKWWKEIIGIGVTGGAVLVFVLFSYLAAQGMIEVTGYSHTLNCAGNDSDPCIAWINFTAKEDIFIYPTTYDPYGRDTPFNFTQGVASWTLQRSWGSSWRTINLSKTWSSQVKYAIKFTKGQDYKLRVLVYKENPNTTIKWGFGDLDPYFLPVGREKYVKLVSNTDYCLDKCKTVYEVCNPTLFDIPLKEFNPSVRFNIAKGEVSNEKVQLERLDYYQVNVTDWGACQEEVECGNNTTIRRCIINTSCIIGSHLENRTSARLESVDYNYILTAGECEKVYITGGIPLHSEVDNVYSFAGYDYEEYAWWNSSWGKNKYLTVTCSQENCEYEPIIIAVFNDSDINSSAGYPDALRLIYNDTTEIPYDWYNLTNRTSGRLAMRSLLNSTNASTTYRIYYDSAASAADYTDSSTWTPYTNDSVNGLFELYYDFEDNDYSPFTLFGAYNNASISGLHAYGNSAYSIVFDADGESIALDSAFTIRTDTTYKLGLMLYANQTAAADDFVIHAGANENNTGAILDAGYPTADKWGTYTGSWYGSNSSLTWKSWSFLKFIVNDSANTWSFEANNSLTNLTGISLFSDTVFDQFSARTPNGRDNEWYIDNLFVSWNDFNMYPTPSTVSAFGAEDNPPPEATLNSPANSSTQTTRSVVLNVSIRTSQSAANVTFYNGTELGFTEEWPTYGGNTNITGNTSNKGPINFGAVESRDMGDSIIEGVVCNGYLYVAADEGVLYQLNASNISLDIIANYTTPEPTKMDHMYLQACDEDYVYMAVDNHSAPFKTNLYQLNASNISQVYKNVNFTGCQFSFTNPVLYGDYLYIAGCNGTDDFIYQFNRSDITDLEHSFNATSYGVNALSQPKIVVTGDYLYTGVTGQFLQLNSSNVSQLIANKSGGDSSSAMSLGNGYVYSHNYANAIYQLNASNISVGGISAATDQLYSSCAVTSDYIYCNGWEGYARQFNASNVSQLIDSFYYGKDYAISINQPIVYGDYVFVTSCEGYHILNASSISNVIANSPDYPTGFAPCYYGAVMANGFLYVGSSDGVLTQIGLNYEPLGEALNIIDEGDATYTWTGLEKDATYNWLVSVYDTIDFITSDAWSFIVDRISINLSDSFTFTFHAYNTTRCASGITYVNGSYCEPANQTNTTGLFNITNNDASTTYNVTLTLNVSLPTGLWIHGSSDYNHSNSINLSTTPQKVIENLAGGASEYLWAWVSWNYSTEGWTGSIEGGIE